VFLHGQGVHDIFQGSPERMWEPNEPRINKIVFIGRNLNKEELEKGFKDCLLKKYTESSFYDFSNIRDGSPAS